jgi:signal transduction histidine kinase
MHSPINARRRNLFNLNEPSEVRMTLPEFIEANLDALVDDWAEFAGQLMSDDQPLTALELQNSARSILLKVAADMRTEQSGAEQQAKSRGEREGRVTDIKDAAQEHANDRLDQGFTLDDVVAEFRAIRATVLRRLQQTTPDSPTTTREIGRFNEAIDQMLTDSIRQYSLRVSQTRDRFAGVLAHDLRSPLGAITNSTEFLMRDETLSKSSLKAVVAVQRSATRMRRMVDDLLDFARTRLGDTLPLNIVPQDVGQLCGNAYDEVSAAYPEADIDVRLNGDLACHCDADRVSQLLINLLVNAIHHGEGGIRLSARSDRECIMVSVSNNGKPIPKHIAAHIFDPLTRSYLPPERRGTAAGVGGLYICKCIVQAHGGSIGVDSPDTTTVFTVRLPRVGKN